MQQVAWHRSSLQINKTIEETRCRIVDPGFMDDAVASVRRFNRFYTAFVGALDSDFLKTGMTLAEARILFEIAQSKQCFADDVQGTLDLDAGFVSRVLRRFEGRRWIRRVRLNSDGRRRLIQLTAEGASSLSNLILDNKRRSNKT